MDPIALAEYLSGMKAAEMATKVQYAVAAKTLDVARGQGQAAIQLIEAAAEGFDSALVNANAGVDPARTLDVYA